MVEPARTRVSSSLSGSAAALRTPARALDTEDRAAKVIAENIRTRLASFFVAGSWPPALAGPTRRSIFLDMTKHGRAQDIRNRILRRAP